MLLRRVARLVREPYRSRARIGHAHALLRLYAEEHGLPEEWADRVLWEFIAPEDWRGARPAA